ncbi:MAG: hypothetical protein LUC26_01925 [Prevotella sp.]|nr:hypothetical protein [Prevotella sp.]
MKKYIKPNTQMFKTNLSGAIALNDIPSVSEKEMNARLNYCWEYEEDDDDFDFGFGW